MGPRESHAERRAFLVKNHQNAHSAIARGSSIIARYSTAFPPSMISRGTALCRLFATTSRAYALAGIAIFSGYTLVDFNRLRRSSADQAIPIAAGIFLDVFNLFLLFLQLFGSGRN